MDKNKISDKDFQRYLVDGGTIIWINSVEYNKKKTIINIHTSAGTYLYYRGRIQGECKSVSRVESLYILSLLGEYRERQINAIALCEIVLEG